MLCRPMDQRNTRLALLALASIGCDSIPEVYEVTVEPKVVFVQLSISDEASVNVTSVNSAPDAVDEVLTFVTDDPEIVTLASVTVTQGFTNLSQIGQELYYIPESNNEATLTVRCLKAGEVTVRLDGDLSGSIANYESRAEFMVTCAE